MKLNFRIIKKDITKESWYDAEWDPEYIEYINMKCLKCDHKETVEADIVLEFFNPRKQDYPLMYCPHCNKDFFVPEDVYDQINGNFHYDVVKSKK